LQSPEFRKPLEAQGYEVLSSTPQEMGALIARDTPAMAAVVKQADIQID
jgi:tripartite-type tricarboxylate transporter receptor subunit TctC